MQDPIKEIEMMEPNEKAVTKISGYLELRTTGADMVIYLYFYDAMLQGLCSLEYRRANVT